MYYWTKPGSARSDVVRWLEAEYLELLELRERVKKAEEAAQRHEQRRRDTPKTVTNCIEPNSVTRSDHRNPKRRRPQK
jgi:hypothetical protein